MINTTRLKILKLCLSVALCASVANAGIAPPAAQKAIKRDDARKLIAAASILELERAAVTVKEIAPPGATANVLASVRLGFHFTKDESGVWRVVAVRTGDRRWEAFDLLARAAGRDDAFLVARAELEALAAELATLVDKKRAAKSDAPKNQAASDATKNQVADKSNQNAAGDKQNGDSDESDPPKELRRGALLVKNPASALTGSSAVVELEVETSVDFIRDARGRWQVARMRVGGRSLEAFETFEQALDTEKRAHARAQLENLAAALEAYRRERGFYVVGETSADLVNHLNPRYTTAYILFDPWHRPYEYAGTRERYTLRSLGADGKANTPDDMTLAK